MKCLKFNEDFIQIQDTWHGEWEWGLWNVNINITFNFIACGSVSQSWDTEPMLLFLDLPVSFLSKMFKCPLWKTPSEVDEARIYINGLNHRHIDKLRPLLNMS